MLSVSPYFFLEFQEKNLEYKPKPIEEEFLSFSSESEFVKEFSFPRLKGLSVYCSKTRPNLEEPYSYFIQIDQSLRQISFPAKLYLRENQEGYYFCEVPSELSIVLEKKEHEIQVHQTLIDTSFHLKKDYLLPIQSYQDRELFSRVPFQILQKGVFLGSDLISSFLGKDRYRFKIGNKLFLIKRGDLLFFDKNKWVLSDTMDDISDKPIVKINNLDPNLEIDCFDVSGRWAQKIYSLAPYVAKKETSLNKIEDVSMRSNTKVSLSIEKQKLFLEEKGWAMKKEGKWSALDSDLVLQEGADAIVYLESIQDGKIIAHWIHPQENTSEKLDIKLSQGSFARKSDRKRLQQRGVQ